MCLAQLTEDGGIIEETHPWLQEELKRGAAEKIFRRAVPDLLAELPKMKCAKTYVHLPAAVDFVEAMAQVKALAGSGWEVREIKQLLPKTWNCCEATSLCREKEAWFQVQSSRVNKADGLKDLCKAM